MKRYISFVLSLILLLLIGSVYGCCSFAYEIIKKTIVIHFPEVDREGTYTGEINGLGYCSTGRMENWR